MFKMKLISKGAEATISLSNNEISKERIQKSYRLPVLDKKLRKSRTKSETKILNKLKGIINVPRVIKTDNEKRIIMEYIQGKKLSDHLEKLNWKDICKKLAEIITKLHDQDIIHGDLTTSNMIYKDNKLYLIDFGLGFHSHKIEDKAVDLHLLKQALNAKHFSIFPESFDIITKNYKAKQNKQILERIKAIEKRGRYRH
mgnify:CR=1 FL=1